MNEFTTIYLVRHGETDWNSKQILQGQSDSPLTEKGLHQAHMLGEQFEHIDFAAIYSSDIGRAKTTAEIIAQYHKKDVNISDLIRERYFGKYEGMKALEMEKDLKDKLAEARELDKDERMAFSLSDEIETDQELVNRLYRFFQKIHSEHQGQKVLTICHGALMRVFLIHIDVARYGQMGYKSFDNLGYLVINTDGHNIELIMAHGLHLNGGVDGG